MLSLYPFSRHIINNFNQTIKHLYVSVKLRNPNDSSSSSSSDSDSNIDSIKVKKYKRNENSIGSNKTKESLFDVLKDGNKKFNFNTHEQTEGMKKNTLNNSKFAFKTFKSKERNFSLEDSLESAAMSVAKTVEDIDKNIESELLNNIKLMKLNNFDLSDPFKRTMFHDESNVSSYFIKGEETKRGDIQYNNSTYTFNRYLRNRIKVLNSFSTITNNKKKLPKLLTWNKMEQKELKIKSTRVPENFFQELIKWTKEGKLWHFPINNEQGLEKEAKIHFSEHIFLERHLKNWCPKSGPLKHFMELVCVGLSKNPFMTVEEKKGHIMWYKNYFEDKKEVFEKLNKDCDATNTAVSTNRKQIQASI